MDPEPDIVYAEERVINNDKKMKRIADNGAKLPGCSESNSEPMAVAISFPPPSIRCDSSTSVAIVLL